MTNGIFITGTDTGVGKTLVSIALIKRLQANNFKVAGMKPIAAGCEWIDQELKNSDAIALQQASSFPIPYNTVNPFALQQPIAPHIAAELEGKKINVGPIQQSYHILQLQADIVIVEGAGGWEVPMNSSQSMADIPLALDLPVILVVGIRLGCLNHALLTQQAILARGVPLAGWVANCIDPDMKNQRENIDYLQRKIQAPLLAWLPYQSPVSIKQLMPAFDSDWISKILANVSLSLAGK